MKSHFLKKKHDICLYFIYCTKLYVTNVKAVCLIYYTCINAWILCADEKKIDDVIPLDLHNYFDLTFYYLFNIV